MRFLVTAIFILLIGNDAVAQQAAVAARILVQDSPLAGFQYYEGRELWLEMKPGDTLTLVREPGNPHDANAIRLEWQGRKLGYVPRRDNSDLARQMDLGVAAEAHITALKAHRNGRNLLSYEISIPLERR